MEHESVLGTDNETDKKWVRLQLGLQELQRQVQDQTQLLTTKLDGTIKQFASLVDGKETVQVIDTDDDDDGVSTGETVIIILCVILLLMILILITTMWMMWKVMKKMEATFTLTTFQKQGLIQ